MDLFEWCQRYVATKYDTNALRDALIEKTHETAEHSSRLSSYALAIGSALCLPQNQMEDLCLLSVFHDVGKVCVPNYILNKPSTLFSEEWKYISKHPELGFNIANSIETLSRISIYILSHHERYDGSGYPQGLVDYNIPILSRIITVVDAYDVMVTGRIYKKPLSKAEAINELYKNMGTQFDPIVVSLLPTVLSTDC